MPFLRVRDKRTRHEFDTPVERANSNKNFVVIDKEPVDSPRPAKHHEPERRSTKPKSVGNESKE